MNVWLFVTVCGCLWLFVIVCCCVLLFVVVVVCGGVGVWAFGYC